MLMSHLETIWAAKAAHVHLKKQKIKYQRVRWITRDNDFIDVDYLNNNASNQSPLWVLFHGLEGSSQSHYARAFAAYAAQNHISYCVPHFRGCSGEINLAPRAYHSGDFEEIDWILKCLRESHLGEIYVVGVSLGGNALMRWAGEKGDTAKEIVQGIISICSPLDLTASGHHLAVGINKYIYTPMFLRSMKRNALLKWNQYPKLFNKNKMLESETLYAFDNAFTAPVHGFHNTEDYWLKASAKPHMQNIKIPALVINALNDPFIPVESLPTQNDVSSSTIIWQPIHGGHVGFATECLSKFPGHLQKLPAISDYYFQTGLLPEECSYG